MKKYLKILFILIVLSKAELNSTLLFKPLTANTFEPRIGSIYEFDNKKLRLDIGASVDLMKLYEDDNNVLTFGTDFFTYTRLRSEGRMKFPVETSDYFFGINSSFKQKNKKNFFEGRLRVSHISSHLVDGLAKDSIFTRMPFVYSREFVDLVMAYNISDFRFYAGLNFLFSTKPKNPEIFSPQLGFDFKYNLAKHLEFIGAYDFRLSGLDGIYSATHSAQISLLMKTSDDSGVLLSFYSLSGKSIHGMFYNENESYIGLGFQVYFY